MTKKRFGCLRLLLIFGLLMICSIAFWALMNFTGGPRDGKPLVRVSPETTAITEPLDDNGDPDYIEYLNRQQSEGVTPENNAAVLIVQAIGPTLKVRPISYEVFQRLGIEKLPGTGDFFVDYDQWLDHLADSAGDDLSAFSFPELNAQYEYANSNPWTAEQFPQLAAWLEKNRQPLDLMRQASLRPRCYYPLIDSSDPPTVIGIGSEIPRAQQDIVKLFAISAMKNLGEGNVAAAFDNTLTIRRHARLLNQGATAIERLMCNGTESMAIHAEWQIALSGKATKQELLDYRAKLSALSPLGNAADCFDDAERYMVLDIAIKAARNKNTETDSSGALDLGGPGIIGSALRASCDWETALLVANPVFDRIVAAMEQQSYKERMAKSQKILDDFSRMQHKLYTPLPVTGTILGGRKAKGQYMGMLITSLLTSPFQAIVVSDTRLESQQRMSLIVLTLEAYKIDHVEYPESLAQLVPEYCDALPLDPFVDEPFHYSRQEDKFRLYAVGMNLRDDQGVGYSDTERDGDDWPVVVKPEDWKTFLEETLEH